MFGIRFNKCYNQRIITNCGNFLGCQAYANFDTFSEGLTLFLQMYIFDVEKHENH